MFHANIEEPATFAGHESFGSGDSQASRISVLHADGVFVPKSGRNIAVELPKAFHQRRDSAFLAEPPLDLGTDLARGLSSRRRNVLFRVL